MVWMGVWVLVGGCSLLFGPGLGTARPYQPKPPHPQPHLYWTGSKVDDGMGPMNQMKRKLWLSAVCVHNYMFPIGGKLRILVLTMRNVICIKVHCPYITTNTLPVCSFADNEFTKPIGVPGRPVKYLVVPDLVFGSGPNFSCTSPLPDPDASAISTRTSRPSTGASRRRPRTSGRRRTASPSSPGRQEGEGVPTPPPHPHHRTMQSTPITGGAICSGDAGGAGGTLCFDFAPQRSRRQFSRLSSQGIFRCLFQ